MAQSLTLMEIWRNYWRLDKVKAERPAGKLRDPESLTKAQDSRIERGWVCTTGCLGDKRVPSHEVIESQRFPVVELKSSLSNQQKYKKASRKSASITVQSRRVPTLDHSNCLNPVSCYFSPLLPTHKNNSTLENPEATWSLEEGNLYLHKATRSLAHLTQSLQNANLKQAPARGGKTLYLHIKSVFYYCTELDIPLIKGHIFSD